MKAKGLKKSWGKKKVKLGATRFHFLVSNISGPRILARELLARDFWPENYFKNSSASLLNSSNASSFGIARAFKIFNGTLRA